MAIDFPMGKEFVKYNIVDRIAIVMIDRPPVNAMSDQVHFELADVFDELKHRISELDVVILTGGGDKVFVAGANLPDWLKLNDVDGGRWRDQRNMRGFNKVRNFERPVIAAINGHALGGGLELAMCCDIRIASENARVGLTETNLGLMPAAGGTQNLPRMIPVGIAKEWMFTGAQIPVKDVERWGLVNKVVPQGEALNEAITLAKKIQEKSSINLSYVKRAINEGLDMKLQEGFDFEAEMVGLNCMTEDKNEGVTAFLQKRKPQFKGR
jgi:enoyl-CoA hydratase